MVELKHAFNFSQATPSHTLQNISKSTRICSLPQNKPYKILSRFLRNLSTPGEHLTIENKLCATILLRILSFSLHKCIGFFLFFVMSLFGYQMMDPVGAKCTTEECGNFLISFLPEIKRLIQWCEKIKEYCKKGCVFFIQYNVFIYFLCYLFSLSLWHHCLLGLCTVIFICRSQQRGSVR